MTLLVWSATPRCKSRGVIRHVEVYEEGSFHQEPVQGLTLATVPMGYGQLRDFLSRRYHRLDESNVAS